MAEGRNGLTLGFTPLSFVTLSFRPSGHTHHQVLNNLSYNQSYSTLQPGAILLTPSFLAAFNVQIGPL